MPCYVWINFISNAKKYFFDMDINIILKINQLLPAIWNKYILDSMRGEKNTPNSPGKMC